MATRSRRSYHDACGFARALDVVGERWSLLIVRELLLGPKRFTDLREAMAVAPDVLSQRLRELEQAGVLRREKLPPPAASNVYALTARGAALEPAVMALGSWGSRLPMAPHGTGMSVDSHVLAMRTLFDPGAAAGLDATYELRIEHNRFRARVDGPHFAIARGEAPDADAVLETDRQTFADLVWQGLDLDEALGSEQARFEGDEALLRRLFVLFPIPAESLAATAAGQ